MDRKDGKVTLLLPKIQRPPPWKDLARCLKCSKPFGLVSRHHHCRHCGGDFCGDCANKFTQIPKYGYIVSEVRVCEECYEVVEAEKEAFKQQNLSGSSQIQPRPQWIYSKACFKCGSVFSTTNCDHHCRHCGQNFCTECCDSFTPIPKFGSFLKKERVCTECLQILQSTGQTSINIQQAPTPPIHHSSSRDSPISVSTSKSSTDSTDL